MRILIAGDFCPRDRVSQLFERGNYESVLGETRELTSQADFSIVNFECPVVDKGFKPISKHGPNHGCSPHGVDAIKWAGFSCVTLANNHFLDYGDDGVRMTIETLNKKGIRHVGGGKNIEEASQVLFHDIQSKRLAIINCCENEFSIATETTSGSNPLNPIHQYYIIQEARKKSDVVLVIVHGGHELFQLPSKRMVDTYRFFIDSGADAVVNHHQHCFSGYEVYKDKPIFYGLGNLCFDYRMSHGKDWTEGYAVLIDFSSDFSTFKIYPYRQCGEKAKVELLQENAFEERIKELNSIISDTDCLAKEVDNYYASCVKRYSSIFEPMYNKYYLAARFKGLLPSLIGNYRKLSAENYISCEAHRDILMWWLKHK